MGSFTLLPILLVLNEFNFIEMSTTEIVAQGQCVSFFNVVFFTIASYFNSDYTVDVSIMLTMTIPLTIGGPIGVMLAHRFPSGRVISYIASLLLVTGIGCVLKVALVDDVYSIEFW